MSIRDDRLQWVLLRSDDLQGALRILRSRVRRKPRMRRWAVRLSCGDDVLRRVMRRSLYRPTQLRRLRHSLRIEPKLLEWTMSMKRFWTAVLGSFIVACGGGGMSSDSLSPTQRITTLDSNQAGQLCDWLAGLFGGYGHSLACDGGGVDAAGPLDQASCASGFIQAEKSHPNCPATVEQFKACWQSQTQCSSAPPSPDCAVLSSTSCS